MPAKKGFTLSELLISLAILGIIATFTIPKVLYASQSSKYNAIAKEAMATLAGAYQQAQLDGIITSATQPQDLIPYINNVKTDTSSVVDERPNFGSSSETCSAGTPCVRLHNGALLWFDSPSFSGTTSLNYLTVLIDPDGTYTGNNDSLKIALYYDGRITTRNNQLPGSQDSTGTFGPISDGDPAWLNWQ